MRLIVGIVTILAGFATAGLAEPSNALRPLLTGNDSRGWEAVGRLDIAGRNMCTGAMIAPDLVLTAAHCLFDKTSGKRLQDNRIKFRAGWRSGRATAYANVKRAVIAPDYTFSQNPGKEQLRNDIAVLQLTQPIRKSAVTPYATGLHPRKGANVDIVSYAHDRAQSPSIEESCRVLARQSGALVLSCDVDFGSSGAPIFAIKDGTPSIVSVVSAMAEVKGRKVALGTALEKPLALILTELKSQKTYFKKALSSQ